MRIISTAFILTFAIFSSCKNSSQHTWSELPQVTNISKLQQTEFVPTLESPIADKKSIIYTTAFLYAWGEIEQKLTSIKLNNNNSNGFKLINQSSSYKNTLNNGEYSADVEINDSDVIARAFFNKTLPFPSKLQKLDNPILFNNTKVSAFGVQSYDEEAATFVEILYYKDDDHFILRLIPKDYQHEIQLVKGIANVNNLLEAVKTANTLINFGTKEKTNPKISWKYSLNDVDIFSIPNIGFNIEKNYSDIEGQVFIANGKRCHVKEAYQRTGFILNENGAVVESKAKVMIGIGATAPIIVPPKKMILDEPFFIIIKRAESDNPYFVMYVQNTEVLTKE